MRIFLCLLLFLVPLSSLAENEILFGIGSGVDIPGPAAPTPGSSMVLSYRHYFKRHTYAYGKLIGYENNNWFGAGMGHRKFFSSRWAFDIGLGLGYLTHPELDPRMTHHRQFNINIGFVYRITNDVSYSISWEHLSNCKTICFGDDSIYDPNDGRDYIVNGIIWRF